MANLKNNGTEVARYVRARERKDWPVLRDTTVVSVRSNGWVLRKHSAVIHDMYHPKGFRLVTAGWKRWYKDTQRQAEHQLIDIAGFTKGGQVKINIIMSAERPARTPDQDVENARRTNELHGKLYEAGIPFRPARGCYRGVEERSIVTLVESDSDAYWLLLELAWEYGQESVLTVTADGVARLVYQDRVPQRIGTFQQVDEHVARASEGWTRLRLSPDPEARNEWWIVNRDECPATEYVELDMALH